MYVYIYLGRQAMSKTPYRAHKSDTQPKGTNKPLSKHTNDLDIFFCVVVVYE